MIKNLAIGGGSNRLLLIFALVLGLTAAVLVGVYLSSLNDGNGGDQRQNEMTKHETTLREPTLNGDQ